MSLEETERMIARQEARERALRNWASEFRGTPLGRVAARILAEDDEAADNSPDYYRGLGFALGVIMDEVL